MQTKDEDETTPNAVSSTNSAKDEDTRGQVPRADRGTGSEDEPQQLRFSVAVRSKTENTDDERAANHTTDANEGTTETNTAVTVPDGGTDENVKREAKTTVESKKFLYHVNDIPPLRLSILSAFQHVLLSISGSFTVSFVVAELVCSRDDQILKTKLISTTMFVSGLATFLQNTIGIRLPLYQGPTIEYIIPILAMSSLSEWNCDPVYAAKKNFTAASAENFTEVDDPMIHIYKRIQMLQGPLIVAGIIHALIGATGLVGVLMKLIGPVTIVPTLLLIGLYIYKVSVKFSETSWTVSVVTSCCSIILSLYLQHKMTPIPFWTPKKGFHIIFYPLHNIFSMLISILIGWALSAILTTTEVLSRDPDSREFYARTDSRNEAIVSAGWFYFPYPGQFGPPRLNVGVFIAFIIATITSIIDSIADYYACARIVETRPPPAHAVNRGILIEGLATVFAGGLGISHGTTTYGGNIGAIAITRVSSRRIFQIVGIIFMILGLIGKLGAVFASIPYPVLGGIQLIYFGSFLGVVLSNLQILDLSSTRNMAIIGISTLVGLMIPYWISIRPGAVKTGNIKLDSIIYAVLGNPNFSGGFLAFFLDNTVPGTRKERGLAGWEEEADQEPMTTQSTAISSAGEKVKNASVPSSDTVYGLPFLPGFIEKSKLATYLPFLPTYKPGRRLLVKCFTSKRSGSSNLAPVNPAADAGPDSRF